MLYHRTINTKTLELLKEIQKKDLFKSLRLVGGTALALQIGHRISDDLDLFGVINADKITISNELNKIAHIIELNITQNIFIYSVNDIKVDIVNYPYPWLGDKIQEDGLQLAGIKDIAAMKLSAITGRGTKKDFIDLYFLLKDLTLEEMLNLYKQKYYDGSEFLVLKSLAYFDDADQDISPKMFTKIKWTDVKKAIAQSLFDFVNNRDAN